LGEGKVYHTIFPRPSYIVQKKVSKQTIPYDYLVVGVGAENATFGIPGVREHGKKDFNFQLVVIK
jgi:NADH dehydrogenase FAD-containing subunit